MALGSAVHPRSASQVLGAIVETKQDPLMVMECMDRGSLYDLLHNPSVLIEPRSTLSILQVCTPQVPSVRPLCVGTRLVARAVIKNPEPFTTLCSPHYRPGHFLVDRIFF